jgi:hypothetical protein
MYPPVEGGYEGIRKSVGGVLKRWCLDVLEPWAQKNDFSDAAVRVKKAADAKNIEVSASNRSLLTSASGKTTVDFTLAIREIGERLSGEALFSDERGPCELIVNPEARGNWVELMSLPKKALVGNDTFSMVAHLALVTVPYSPYLYLRVGAAKRVWATKRPGLRPSAPRRVTAYIFGPPGRPVLPVSVVRTKDGWEFGDDYLSVRLESKNQLPETLAQAVQQREPGESGWWVGLPELTTLFDSVSPRTVFEADELDLLNTVASLLTGIADSPIEFSTFKVRRRQAKSVVAMLKLTDVGLAGAALADAGDETDEEALEPTDGEDTEQAGEQLAQHREQNIRALKLVHGERRPCLWSFGGTPAEQDLIRKSVEALFGDAVVYKPEVLPRNTHGLREQLPEAIGTAKERFDARVRAWTPAANAIRQQEGPRFALICAADREGRKAEDVVNYYAGTHAMCHLGEANVHYVLPISGPDSDRATQNFIHRLQSALLDVFLAHSGVVFGVKEYLEDSFKGNPPKSVYGIQVVRSRARAFSGESDVTFIVISRLLTENGVTEVQFCYPVGKQNKRSRWFTLNEGLRWLASQRQLDAGGEPWLRQWFKGIIRDTLGAIEKDDPRALVLIDWDSVGGLWAGIRDSDLAVGAHPKLDAADLAATFPGMSLVRVRRSLDSMAVRGLARATFDGWREGATRESTGERRSEQYATTTKCLIEMRPPGVAESVNSGHFISSMGYGKTAQVKRGFSCYRYMPRMSAIRGTVASGEKARLFESTTLDPANMDASVPAPLEITVMSSPADVTPAEVALTVMGLRLGYAHYNDWTALPAPLFFKRKIEDYVIRYSQPTPQAITEEPLDETPSSVVELEDTATQQSEAETKLSQAVIDSVLPTPKLEVEPAAPSEGTPRVARALAAETQAGDPLAYAKNLEVPVLYSTSDPKVTRLYQAMMQEAPGVRIRVDLPSFVTRAGLFGDLELTSRDCRRIWRWTREFGYVRQTLPQPTTGSFLDWMRKRLEKPQGAYTFDAPLTSPGNLLWPVQLILDRYNQESSNPIKISRDDLSVFKELTEWAVNESDDEAVAWLLFNAAQMPAFGCAKSILAGIERLPGPLSREALQYFVDSAEACAEAIARKSELGRSAFAIHKKRAASWAVVQLGTVGQPIVIGEQAVKTLSSQSELAPPFEELVMQIKNAILSNLSKLQPGGDDFGELMHGIQKELTELERLHASRTEERAAVERAQAERTELHVRANALLSELEGQRPDFLLNVTLRLPLEGHGSTLNQQLDQVAAALTKIGERRATEAQLAAPLPAGASLAERRQRSREVTESLSALTDALKELEDAVQACSAFVAHLPPSQGPGVQAPEVASVVTPESQPSEAPVASAEPEPDKPRETAMPAVPMPALREKQPASVTPPVPSIEPVRCESEAAADPTKIEETVPESLRNDEAVMAEDEEQEDEAPDATLFDESARNAAFEVLLRLVDDRRYALATVHLEAMAELLPPAVFAIHRTILTALLVALESIDCNFAVEAQLDPKLLALLNEKVPGNNELCDQLPLALGVLGAGIISMLLDPSGANVRWAVLSYLQGRLGGLPAVAVLVERIATMDNIGIAITRDQFAASHIGARKAIDAELNRMRSRASDWSRAPELHSIWNNHAWRRLHEEMFSASYPIGHCLALISKGEDGRLEQAYADAYKKFQKPSLTLEELSKKTRERSRPDGKPRHWLIANLTATQRFVEAYLELTRKRAMPDQRVPGNIHAYLTALHSDLLATEAGLEKLRPGRPVEALYRQTSLAMLRSVLRLFDEVPPAACVPYNTQLLLIQLPMGHDLKPSMSHRYGPEPEGATAVCEPMEVLEETSRLAGEPLLIDSEDEEAGLAPALRDAAQAHLASNRFVPAFAINAIVPDTFKTGEASLASAYQKTRSTLDAELHESRQHVAHAMSLSALDTGEANRMLRVIEDIRTANNLPRSIGSLAGESVTYPDFPHAKAALRRSVLEPLDSRLTSIRAKLTQQVDSYESTHGQEAARDIARVREMLKVSNASNLRTAHDAFAMLKNEGRLPPAALNASRSPEQYEQFQAELNTYASSHNPVLETLRTKLDNAATEGAPQWVVQLDDNARRNAVEFLDSWLALYKPGLSNEAANAALSAFFQRMGLAEPPTVVQEPVRVHNRNHFYMPDRPFAAATGDVFVPPNLGSKGAGVQGYVLGGRPQEQELRSVIQEVGATPTFVLARPHLTLEKRSKLSRGFPVLLVDDDLVAYMAVHPGERIRRLLDVGLLTYFANPYADYSGTPVPPEMFFGRHHELTQLRNVQGSAVLYGGRRLGKSSLLDQLEREGQQRPGGNAVYISVDEVKYATDYVLSAWNAVCKALAARKTIAAMPHGATDWKEVRNWIEKELSSPANTAKSCYLLLDEADELMKRELDASPKAPSFVRSLQHLCESVQKRCHIRYVIAGLHNVTRMSTEENSPLGKAEAIALEPFTSADDIQRGIELVTKPLAALGFYFAKGSEDLPLRILSVCNFYPAFIQLYCKNLLERMYNIRQDNKPPIYIRATDLDAVERDGNLLSDLQRKFELNLNLDKRYKAIALILADVYYGQIASGQYDGLTVTEIAELCQTYAGQHFEHTGAGAYEALVDEMRKLNVLERVRSRYVLRNPNIAMMMGDRERISHLIDELAKEKPEQARSHGERRPTLEYKNGKALFPMPAAWVRTNVEQNDGELLVLVGNVLSGLAEISSLAEDYNLGAECVYIVKKLDTAQSATSYLKRLAGMSNGRKRLVAVSPVSWKVSQIADFASAAMKNAKVARLALIALPDKAYDLAKALDAGTLQPARPDSPQRWRIVPIPQWTDDAVHFQLDENIAVAENIDACRALLEASAGFGTELGRLCSMRLTVAEAKALPAKRHLAPDLPTFYKNIGMPASMDGTTVAKIQDFVSLVEDGTDRKSADVDEAMGAAEVTPWLVQFITWMGLLQPGPGNTWQVPSVYRRLLAKA